MFTAIMLATVVAAGSGESAYSGIPIEERERLVERYRAAVATAERQLADAEAQSAAAAKAVRGTRKGRQRDTAERKAKTLSDYSRRVALKLDGLRTNDPPYVAPIIEPKVGFVGRLGSLEVRQRLSGDEAICDHRWSIDGREGAYGYAETATRTGSFRAAVRSEGVFKDIADGQVVSVNGYWIVTGTKTYPTETGGTTTVPVLEPYEWPKPKTPKGDQP